MRFKRKRLFILLFSFTFIFSGCSIWQPLENSQKQNEAMEPTSIIAPDVKVNEEYYRGVLPYKPSPIAGMLKELPRRLDSNKFELGLIEIAKNEYDPSEFVFQEGQVLTMNEIEPILDQYQDFLYSVVEHDYLHEDGTYGGVVVGLFVSSVYQEGETIKSYTDDQIRERSKEIANKILSMVRKKVTDPSILFGIVKAEEFDMKLPGTFILKGEVKEKENSIDDWTNIEESYLFLPAKGSSYNGSEGDISLGFNQLKDQLNEYLPGFAGLTGLARFVNGNLIELTINVNTEFDSTVEVIQFTQFAIALISKYFPTDSQINLYVQTIDQPKAIYIRQANGDDFVHIYRD
ncbi:CamS family sex pheromone protein [Tepidibacillus infernus]|uniref:CamS family sex pheromone protein n=1 Tax=Tepidibacillus TaxID=1494427 RepID=UPI0008534002|nr:CamS family sex pheromone protein [Tepidibacillus sp. HK-1]GBF10778.1 camS sex pheromone cAM373 precursor [Tepidibacillus sp. HK-1]